MDEQILSLIHSTCCKTNAPNSVHPFLKKWHFCTISTHRKIITHSVHPFIENGERKIMVANSTFLWPYNWPLDWPFWCNLLTEGVVYYEELGNALSKKCANSVHPKNATEYWSLICCKPTLGEIKLFNIWPKYMIKPVFCSILSKIHSPFGEN